MCCKTFHVVSYKFRRPLMCHVMRLSLLHETPPPGHWEEFDLGRAGGGGGAHVTMIGALRTRKRNSTWTHAIMLTRSEIHKRHFEGASINEGGRGLLV